MQGLARFHLGELIVAREFLEKCFGLADPAHRNVKGLSLDPYPTMLVYLALTLAHLGYIDQAQSRVDDALSEARRRKHVHTLAYVLTIVNWIDWIIGLPNVHIEEFLSLATEQGFPFYLGWALAHRGRGLVELGRTEEGLVLLTQALAKLHSTGAMVCLSILFTWLAEAYAALGQPDEERKCLAEATRVIETNEERAVEAELLRVQGDLLNTADDQFGAEQRYRQAIAVAERRSAKLFQLRASVSLARLWRDQDRRAEARDLLTPIYGWFTEGFDVPVLKEAKTLLDELA
jgi:tetratricopeptide (TPR) repeat protein